MKEIISDEAVFNLSFYVELKSIMMFLSYNKFLRSVLKRLNSPSVCFLLITIFISINSFFFTSCNRNENSEIKDLGFYLELVDSVKIEIPYEFGLVFPKVIDGKLLAYSYLDQTFHVLDSKGRLQNSFNHQGEGPKDYTRNLSFVTINNGHLIFMDNKKLSYFSYQGEWVKSIPFNDPNKSLRGGMPSNELDFVGENKFIVPNIYLDGLSRRPDHRAVLDSVPIWLQYEYSQITNQFEITEFGHLDTMSVFFSDFKYNSYSPKTFVDGGNVNLFFNLTPIIYTYSIGESKYPIEKIKFDVPGFKEPIGLDYKSMTIDNYRHFNKASDINSHINDVISLDNERIFFVYSQGKNIRMNDSEADAIEAPDPLFYGYYYDFSSRNGSQVVLPEHNGHPSFWKKISYLGNNKFLFVFENEIERDFYWGKIFELKSFNH